MEKSNIKILLVDDEPDIIEILTYNLNKEGYQVFSASNGKEALVQASKIIPHLIFRTRWCNHIIPCWWSCYC